MTRLNISAYLAIAYGLGLAGFETLVNWGQWQWWPWWLVDYVAAGLLLSGGVAVLKLKDFASKLLCSGWAFTLGMLWMSLASNISQGTDPARMQRVIGLYVLLIIFGIAVSLSGLILALFANKKRVI